MFEESHKPHFDVLRASDSSTAMICHQLLVDIAAM